MGVDQDLTVKRISSLKTYYGQLRQKFLSFKSKSGSGADEAKKQTWFYFDSLPWTPRNSRKLPSSNNVTQQEVLSKALMYCLREKRKRKPEAEWPDFWGTDRITYCKRSRRWHKRQNENFNTYTSIIYVWKYVC